MNTDTGTLTNTIYCGRRIKGEPIVVTRNGLNLDPAASLAVWNHSPDGFEWGYGGSGPAQLALALLLDVFPAQVELCARMHQRFKWQVVARWERDWWVTTAQTIHEWVTSQPDYLDVLGSCLAEGGEE